MLIKGRKIWMPSSTIIPFGRSPCITFLRRCDWLELLIIIIFVWGVVVCVCGRFLLVCRHHVKLLIFVRLRPAIIWSAIRLLLVVLERG